MRGLVVWLSYSKLVEDQTEKKVVDRMLIQKFCIYLTKSINAFYFIFTL
jgi:hypothetical protein